MKGEREEEDRGEEQDEGGERKTRIKKNHLHMNNNRASMFICTFLQALI